MIAYIEGKVVANTENSCIVATVSGVGYEVFVAAPTLAANSVHGQDVHFYISTVVREDAFELFGFPEWDERETFILLRSINRVGARTALAILAVFSTDDLRRICAEEDVYALTRVSGIGKKTAQQVFIELKFKLANAVSTLSVVKGLSSANALFADATAALLNLGYDEQESHAAVKKALAEADQNVTNDVGGVLRKALKILAGGKV